MLSSTDLVQAVTADLEKIRETAPLVLSLTNSVVQPLTANLLLAIGAVPACSTTRKKRWTCSAAEQAPCWSTWAP